MDNIFQEALALADQFSKLDKLDGRPTRAVQLTSHRVIVRSVRCSDWIAVS